MFDDHKWEIEKGLVTVELTFDSHDELVFGNRYRMNLAIWVLKIANAMCFFALFIKQLQWMEAARLKVSEIHANDALEILIKFYPLVNLKIHLTAAALSIISLEFKPKVFLVSYSRQSKL